MRQVDWIHSPDIRGSCIVCPVFFFSPRPCDNLDRVNGASLLEASVTFHESVELTHLAAIRFNSGLISLAKTELIDWDPVESTLITERND